MYLYAKKYIAKQANPKEGDAYDLITSRVYATSFFTGHFFVEGEIAYWRKANAIHNWFIQLHDSEDDCSPIHVNKDNLQELQKICKEVIDKPELASDLLPTVEGFFFGGTLYDEWYHDSIKYTHNTIDTILKTVPDEWSFIYQASW